MTLGEQRVVADYGVVTPGQGREGRLQLVFYSRGVSSRMAVNGIVVWQILHLKTLVLLDLRGQRTGESLLLLVEVRLRAGCDLSLVCTAWIFSVNFYR